MFLNFIQILFWGRPIFFGHWLDGRWPHFLYFSSSGDGMTGHEKKGRTKDKNGPLSLSSSRGRENGEGGCQECHPLFFFFFGGGVTIFIRRSQSENGVGWYFANKQALLACCKFLLSLSQAKKRPAACLPCRKSFPLRRKERVS